MPKPNEELEHIDLDTADDQPAGTDNTEGNTDDQLEDKSQQASSQTDDNQDQFVTDEEYLAPYYAQGMPQSIKSLDDAMSWAISMTKGTNAPQSQESIKLQQLNRMLAQQGFVGGVDEFLYTGGQRQYRDTNNTHQNNSNYDQNRNQQAFIPDNPYRTTIDADIQSGLIPQEQANVYRAFANTNDRALKQVTSPITDMLRKMAAVVASHDKAIKDAEFRMLPRKIREGVKKFELDSVISSGYADTYEDAFIYHARQNNPSLLAEYFSQGKGNGNMNNNGKRPQSMTRQNISQRQNQQRQGFTGGANVDKYTLPDGRINQAELDKLKPEESAKVLREILKRANTMR